MRRTYYGPAGCDLLRFLPTTSALEQLLEHGADVADIGLTEEEKRELLAG